MSISPITKTGRKTKISPETQEKISKIKPKYWKTKKKKILENKSQRRCSKRPQGH